MRRDDARPVMFYVSSDDRDLLERLAKRDGIPMREVLVRALRQYADVEPTSLEQRVARLECAVAEMRRA